MAVMVIVMVVLWERATTATGRYFHDTRRCRAEIVLILFRKISPGTRLEVYGLVSRDRTALTTINNSPGKKGTCASWATTSKDEQIRSWRRFENDTKQRDTTVLRGIIERKLGDSGAERRPSLSTTKTSYRETHPTALNYNVFLIRRSPYSPLRTSRRHRYRLHTDGLLYNLCCTL